MVKGSNPIIWQGAVSPRNTHTSFSRMWAMVMVLCLASSPSTPMIRDLILLPTNFPHCKKTKINEKEIGPAFYLQNVRRLQVIKRAKWSSLILKMFFSFRSLPELLWVSPLSLRCQPHKRQLTAPFLQWHIQKLLMFGNFLLLCFTLSSSQKTCNRL